jgi:Cytosol aminopeptidase family, catalytic domain
VRAGEQSGERVWPFPLDDDYEEDLKSDIADILQVPALRLLLHTSIFIPLPIHAFRALLDQLTIAIV